MPTALWRLLGMIVLIAVLLLVWWGWQEGGLALLQLGMGLC